MNWDAIGAVGQMLGSVAVFITLAYLAVQIRHSRSEARRALSQGRGEALRQLMLTRVTEPQLNDLYGKAGIALGGGRNQFMEALMERAGMTWAEAAALSWDQHAWFSYRLQIISKVDELPPMERTAFDGAIRSTYGQPGAPRTFYESIIKPLSHPDAVRYIDNLLAQPG